MPILLFANKCDVPNSLTVRRLAWSSLPVQSCKAPHPLRDFALTVTNLCAWFRQSRSRVP